jgi:hypothetical protein
MKQILLLGLLLCIVVAIIVFINYKRSKVAICSLSDRPQYTKYSWKVMEDYCSKHGYDFVTENQSLDADRHTAWSKIILMERELDKGYDIVIWIDDDIIITERSESVDAVFKDFINSDKKIAVAKDTMGELANTGIISVKKEGKPLLRRIYDDGITNENRWEQLWDQTAFNTMYKDIKDDVHLYEPGTIQGFYRSDDDPPEFKWKKGVWAAHMAGCPEKERVERMRNLTQTRNLL